MQTTVSLPPLAAVARILVLVWAATALPAPLVGAFIGLDGFWVINLVTNLVLLLGALWFWREFYQKGRHELFSAYRKFVGYGIVVGYCLVNIASISWGSDLMWILSSVQGITGWLVWLCLRFKPTEQFYGYAPPAKGTKKSLKDATLENIDIVIQTIFLVIVLQQLVFQLYVIPSESMVPTLMVNDRPVVSKFLDGPEIPMSSAKLPTLTGVERGQIVVFETPVYDEPPVITQMIQKLVFFLTLSTVNLDVDEYGNPKVQFVVKRVTGVPGEKLMMVNDQLYSRTASAPEWAVVEADAAYRHVDLWKEPASLQRQIQAIPVKQADREAFDQYDQLVKESDPETLRAQLTAEVASLTKALNSPGARTLEAAVLVIQPRLLKDVAFPASTSAGELVAALAPPAPLTTGANLYERNARVVNLMYKTLLAKTLRAEVTGDAEAGKVLLGQTASLQVYVLYAYDMRNFPEYPAGEGNFIPEGKYFLMRCANSTPPTRRRPPTCRCWHLGSCPGPTSLATWPSGCGRSTALWSNSVIVRGGERSHGFARRKAEQDVDARPCAGADPHGTAKQKVLLGLDLNRHVVVGFEPEPGFEVRPAKVLRIGKVEPERRLRSRAQPKKIGPTEHIGQPVGLVVVQRVEEVQPQRHRHPERWHDNPGRGVQIDSHRRSQLKLQIVGAQHGIQPQREFEVGLLVVGQVGANAHFEGSLGGKGSRQQTDGGTGEGEGQSVVHGLIIGRFGATCERGSAPEVIVDLLTMNSLGNGAFFEAEPR